MLTIYKASAGSGKTYTLAFEYIKLVLGYKDSITGKYKLNPNPQYSHRAILAITFTNKATEEMKRRIIKELAILAKVPSIGDEESPYTESLTSLFECTPQQLRKCAQKALVQLLFDFNFFNISTIDAFFQTILRTFAFEVELDGNYEVELNDSYAISIGVNELLNTISHKNDKESHLLAEWIKRYMMQKINEGASFNILNRKSKIFGNLLSFIGKLCDEQFKLKSDKLVEYLQDNSRIITFEEKLKEQIAIKENTIKKIASGIFETLSLENIDSEGISSHVKSLLIKWSNGEKKEPNDTILKVRNHETSAFTKTFLKKNPISNDIELFIANAIDQIITQFDHLRSLKLLRNNIYGLGLIGDTMKFIKEFRDNNNLILLSDTNDLLRRVINEDDAPFIYERLGVRLQHFLIDEFQDTSRLQWSNINPLVSESLSQNHDNLIIGDEKQCIYRFRNSDPSLLHSQIALDFNQQVQERGNNIKDNTNWRSSAEVVRFNNTIFSALAFNFGLSDVYANVAQQVAVKHLNHHGYIKFSCIDDSSTKEEKLNISFEIMANDIKRQLNAGYQARDIAILVRNRKEGQLAIDYLLQLMANASSGFPQINIISDDTLQIDSSPMVRLIISVLRLINTSSEVSDSNLISKQRFNQILNRYELHINNGKKPGDALNEAINVDNIEIDNLAKDVTNLKYTSLPSIIERIISRYIPKDLLIRDNIFITAFQDEVLDFCSHGSCDINSFLKWWDNPNVNHKVTSSTDIDAIRVMTIHKSKGLEFKCVHIPVADWDLTKDSDYSWFEQPTIDGISPELIPPVFALKNDKNLIGTQFEDQYNINHKLELIDTINVTYVAFTRAINELCVTCLMSKNNRNNSIGGAIYDAFSIANNDFCDNLTAKHKEANGELFIPLNDIDEKNTLIIGKPTSVTPKKGSENPHNEDVEIRTASPYFTADRDDLWNLTRLDDFIPSNEARERGVFLHNVLSNVIHINDLPLSLKRWSYRSRLSNEETEDALNILAKTLSTPFASQWFDGFNRVLTERSISLYNSNDTYRPDRIVWTANGTIDIIDYKFGEENKSKHQKQIKNYMNLLIEMGYKNVRGFLWYFNKNQIIEIN